MYSSILHRSNDFWSGMQRRGLHVAAVTALFLFAFLVSACDSTDADPEPDIVEVTVENDFNTLVTAIETADLVSTLKEEGPFTVFAPTDAAFDALPDGTLESLLEPENREQLVDILTYHVVSGRVTADEVVNLETATTLQGSSLDISTENGAVFVNDAQVTATDVEASNGVVHVIDAVLLPPSDE